MKVGAGWVQDVAQENLFTFERDVIVPDPLFFAMFPSAMSTCRESGIREPKGNPSAMTSKKLHGLQRTTKPCTGVALPCNATQGDKRRRRGIFAKKLLGPTGDFCAGACPPEGR